MLGCWYFQASWGLYYDAYCCVGSKTIKTAYAQFEETTTGG